MSPPDAERAARYALACWITALLAMGFGATLVCRVPNCGATAFDRSVMELAHGTRSQSLDSLFTLLTWGGSLWLLLPLTLVVLAACMALRQRGRPALFLAAALAGASAVAHAGKLLVTRARPELFDPIVSMPTDFAYPSAHSAQIAAFCLGLCLIARSLRPSWLGWVVPVTLLATVSIAYSRIYLQVHYPSDVVAGLAVGVLWVLGLGALLLRERAR